MVGRGPVPINERGRSKKTETRSEKSRSRSQKRWSLSPPPILDVTRKRNVHRSATPPVRLYKKPHRSDHLGTTLMTRGRTGRDHPSELWGPLGEYQSRCRSATDNGLDNGKFIVSKYPNRTPSVRKSSSSRNRQSKVRHQPVTVVLVASESRERGLMLWAQSSIRSLLVQLFVTSHPSIFEGNQCWHQNIRLLKKRS